MKKWLEWLPWVAANKRLVAAALTAVLALVGVPLVVTADDPAPPPPTAAPPAEAPAPASDLTSDLREEAGIPPEDAAANRKTQGARRSPARAPAVARPPCRTDYSGGVWSSRNGVRPTEFVLHYTVSSNRPGWADVLAIENYFSSSRVASSTYIVDFEGHCLKMVPESQKPWTQGNANPWAISVEIIATGRESVQQWRDSRLIKDKVLARLVRNVMDRWGLPLRWVNPVGCVFPPGLTTHARLECNNFHTDVDPHFPHKLFLRQVRAL
jgi:hypothetical protein